MLAALARTSIGDVGVVEGAHPLEELADGPSQRRRVVRCDDWALGPGASLRCGLAALGASLCGFFPINVAIIHWFEKRRARALSVLGLGLALGGSFVPAVAWSMQDFGWRATAFASGVLAILVAACDWSIGAPRSGVLVTVQVRGDSIFAGHAAVVDGVPLELEWNRAWFRVEHEHSRSSRAPGARLVRVALTDQELIVVVVIKVGGPGGVTPL